MSKDPDFDRKLSGALNEMSERHIEEAAKAVRLEHNGLKIFRNIALSAGAVAAAAAIAGVIISNMPETRRGVDLVESSKPVDPSALLEALPTKANDDKPAETEKTIDEEPAEDAELFPECKVIPLPLAADKVITESYTVPKDVSEELLTIEPVELTDEYLRDVRFGEGMVPELLYVRSDSSTAVFTDGIRGVYGASLRDNVNPHSAKGGCRFMCKIDLYNTVSAVESLLPFEGEVTYGAGAFDTGDELHTGEPILFAFSDKNELLCWRYDSSEDSDTCGKLVLLTKEEIDKQFPFVNLNGRSLPGSNDPDNVNYELATGFNNRLNIYSETIENFFMAYKEGCGLSSLMIAHGMSGTAEICMPFVTEKTYESAIDTSNWALPLDEEYTPDTSVYRSFHRESVDIPDMQNVYAAGDGEIVYNDSFGLWGKTIVIRLDSGEYVRYADLYDVSGEAGVIDSAEYPDIALNVGDRVKKGQVIALTGSSGMDLANDPMIDAYTADEYEYISKLLRLVFEKDYFANPKYPEMLHLARDFIYDCYYKRVYMYGNASPFSDFIDNEYLLEYAETAIQYEKPHTPTGEGPFTRSVSVGGTAVLDEDTYYVDISLEVDFSVDIGIGYETKAENRFEYDCVVVIRDGKVVDFSVGNMGGANIAWIYGMRLNPDAFDMTHNPNPWEDEGKAKAVLDYYKNAITVQTIVNTDWNALSGKEIWALLSDYSGVDIGSGLYVMAYLIADDSGEFGLTVGGVPDSEICYVTLTHTSGKTLQLYGEQHSAEEIISFFGEPSRVNCYDE